MPNERIIQNLILETGCSQAQRSLPALDVGYAEVDGRTPVELFRFVQNFAALVNYHTHSDTLEAPPAGGDAPVPATWEHFFPPADLDSLIRQKPGELRADLALMQVFFELYQHARGQANDLTRQHLDFYYKRVLRLARRAPRPDHAHLLIELKKGTQPIEIGPDHLFTAGKDAKGVERIYQPVRNTVINHARVESLRSVFVDRRAHGSVRFAPIANSTDGLGGELTGEEPKWRAFGYPALPRAEVGFAIASPVLRMRAGTRKVTLTLRLGGLKPEHLSNSALQNAFAVFVTGEKNWIEVDVVQVSVAGDTTTWEFTIPASAPAVADYAPAIHGYAYAATAPIVQLLLRGDTTVVGYLDFTGVTVQSAQLSVEVTDITALTVENDVGAVDPKKAFMPFGPEPTAGSRLMIAYPEALNKRLTRVDIEVEWKGAPTSFAAFYDEYGVTVNNNSFQVAARFRDGTGREFSADGLPLFDTSNAQSKHTLSFTPGATTIRPIAAGHVVRALHLAGARWAVRQANRDFLAMPILNAFRRPAAAEREGFITLTLNRSFLHTTYRRKHLQNVLQYAKSGSGTPTVLNEPYTPTIQSISLSYRATTTVVPISSTELTDFASSDIQFFQLTPFGPMREHGYQRSQFAFLNTTDVTLMPLLPHEGELLIGLADLRPDQSVSLLFQIADGTADPELPRQPVKWFVLSDNYWRALSPSELVMDTTNNLLTSGLVQIVVPREATTQNTILPSERIWIKAAVASNVNAVSQLVSVAANAIEVVFVDRNNDPAHLDRPLPAGSIARLKDGLAAIKAVTQRFASFGALPAEPDPAFYTRVAERLRHKDRCVTAWDYERVVLEAFPAIHKVKCVPHADGRTWLTPGHVLLVVVPALHNRNAIDPLQPKVDADTLDRVRAHVAARCGEQIQPHVKNPRYQKIRLDFKVRFRVGYEFNFYRNELERDIIRRLSPWAFPGQAEITFGGRVSKSVLLDFIEERSYVDFVTDFRMYSFAGDVPDLTDLSEAYPATPDAILVSDRTHSIVQAA